MTRTIETSNSSQSQYHNRVRATPGVHPAVVAAELTIRFQVVATGKAIKQWCSEVVLTLVVLSLWTLEQISNLILETMCLTLPRPTNAARQLQTLPAKYKKSSIPLLKLWRN